MARRYNVYTGLYIPSHRMQSFPLTPPRNLSGIPSSLRSSLPDSSFTEVATSYFWTIYSSMNGNYVAIATVCLVVLMTFILPDISHKIHRTNELKSMKKILNSMKKEVSKAEVACITVAGQFGSIQCSMHDGSTETSKNNQDLAVCTSESVRMTQSAPVQVEKKVGLFRRIFFPFKNNSVKEVTLMSYVYTDSFDNFKNKTTVEA